VNDEDKYLTEMMSANFERPVRIKRVETIEVVDDDDELLAIIENAGDKYQVRIDGEFTHMLPKLVSNE